MSSSFAGPFCVAGCLAFARLRLARALSFRYKSKDFVSYCCLTSLIKHQPSPEVALPAAAQRRAVFQARISGTPSGQARCSESVLWRTLTRKRQNWTPHFTRRSNRFSLGEVAGENVKCTAQSAQKPARRGERWAKGARLRRGCDRHERLKPRGRTEPLGKAK